jgi:spore germination cell wall hydrolase CwlJ-like protein
VTIDRGLHICLTNYPVDIMLKTADNADMRTKNPTSSSIVVLTKLYSILLILVGVLTIHSQYTQSLIPSRSQTAFSINITQHPTIEHTQYANYVDTAPEWNITTNQQFNEELVCLAQNIYFEARNQSTTGMVAVGLVTINRVKSRRFPDTICDVVWQKRRHPQSRKWVAQFSWTWDGKHDRPTDIKSWKYAKLIAGTMIAEGSLDNFFDFTDGADHYHAVYVSPRWSKQLYMVNQFDDHIFYRISKINTNDVVRSQL